VKNITDAAGVTKGTFYVHFESKDALVASLIAVSAAQLDLEYKTFLNTLPPDMPVSGVLLALTEKIAAVISETVGYETMKAVYQMQLTGTVNVEGMKGYSRELYHLICGILEQGIRRGELKTTLPPQVLSRHLVMALRGLCYEWCIRYPDFDLKEQAVEHTRLLIDGIAKSTIN
jgi:AcrR family transcriptional regulator